MDASRETPWPEPGFRPPPLYGALRDTVQAGTRFDVRGSGPAVVLLHGVGLDMSMWDGVAAGLEKDYTVVRFDMLGHGGSAKPVEAIGLDAYVWQLREMADYFQMPRFALIGFSMGALIARAYAARHPDRLSCLCLMSGVYQRDAAQRAAVKERLDLATREGPGAIIDAALARWFTEDFAAANPTLLNAVRARLEANDPRAFLAAYRIFAEADDADTGDVSRIGCPALVATGDLDKGSTPDMARRLAADLPDGRSEIWRGLAHLAPVQEPSRVAATIRGFLEGIGR